MMNKSKGCTRAEFLTSVAIVITLATLLFPVFTRARTASAGRCQSNMSAIGKAIKMYLADWQNTYPTNRLNQPMNTFIAQTIPLSDPTNVGPDGEPIRFQYGVNWVEAMYPYIGRAAVNDPATVWRCPSAEPTQYGGTNSAVSYAFNANLVEKTRATVRNPANLLMVRELDRLQNSVLKPSQPTPGSSPAPINPFLNDYEMGPNNVRYKLHENGSHILFADGHVSYFPLDYFPHICQWNAATGQWFNFVSSVGTDDPRRLSIAVTP